MERRFILSTTCGKRPIKQKSCGLMMNVGLDWNIQTYHLHISLANISLPSINHMPAAVDTRSLWVCPSPTCQSFFVCCYRLRDAGFKLKFCTNETVVTKKSLVEKLRGLGFSLSEGEVHSPAPACITYLRENNLRPLLLGKGCIQPARLFKPNMGATRGRVSIFGYHMYVACGIVAAIGF